MPLTDGRQNAVAEIRTVLGKMSFPFGTAESIGQRARHPCPAHVPTDVGLSIDFPGECPGRGAEDCAICFLVESHLERL